MDDAHIDHLLAALPLSLIAYLRKSRTRFLHDDESIKAAILNGRVRLNGEMVLTVQDVVLPCDVVTLDNILCTISRESIKNIIIYAYNKPKDMICDDSVPFPRGLGGIASHFCEEEDMDIDHLHPVGRLDKNTTGLLLFCNDGDLTRLILQPGNVAKEYVVGWVASTDSGGMTSEALTALRDPLPLLLPSKNRSDCCASFESCSTPIQVEDVPAYDGRKTRAHFECTVKISSGQNHVVKRLFQQHAHIAIGHLHRQAIGPVNLEQIGLQDKPGGWIRLPDSSVAQLQDACGGLLELLRMKREELSQRLCARPEDARLIMEAMSARNLLEVSRETLGAWDREALNWLYLCASRALVGEKWDE